MKLLRSYRIFFLSIGIAFLMWFYVKLTSTFTHTIDIPFQVINVKPGFGIVSDLPETIPVVFEADWQIFRRGNQAKCGACSVLSASHLGRRTLDGFH